jgi:hypothetical protein
MRLTLAGVTRWNWRVSRPKVVVPGAGGAKRAGGREPLAGGLALVVVLEREDAHALPDEPAGEGRPAAGAERRTMPFTYPVASGSSPRGDSQWCARRPAGTLSSP